MTRGKGIKNDKLFKQELEKHIRESLDTATLYF